MQNTESKVQLFHHAHNTGLGHTTAMSASKPYHTISGPGPYVRGGDRNEKANARQTTA
jgi:hypothetical protein